MLFYFKDLPEDKKQVGGKAYMLAMMTQMGIEVPNGIILDAPPTESELAEIKKFARDGQYSLAIRSSATGEDSKENSFAGQNSTFLYVDNDEDLISSIDKCFNSIHKESSKAYRKHFLGSDRAVPMNVVIQRMIDPKYAGVYFSKDPRGKYSSWMIEYIDGVGEDLVSGKRTPTILSEENSFSVDISEGQISMLVSFAQMVEEKYQDDFDIEWAIDKNGKVYLLQARPITAKSSQSELNELAKNEIERLEKSFSDDTVWDGQTFAEWTVSPTHLTTQVWRNSFNKGQAFDQALKKLGYLGFTEDDKEESILDTVFGRNYINLNKLGQMYFGPIPYSIEPYPRPHLQFHFSKVTPKVIFNTPVTLMRMLKVGLSINTHRQEMIDEASRELVELMTILKRPNSPSLYAGWSDEALDQRIRKEFHLFSKETLLWPYVLISLAETTIQTLISLLKGSYGDKEANELIKKWSGAGIQSETYKMGLYFKKACARLETRELFMAKYGHRGAGELDLSAKRWVEIGDDAFYEYSYEEYEKTKNNHAFLDVEAEIQEMKTFKKSLILEEWKLLKQLLELREKWKSAILKPYSHLRYLFLEKSKRLGLEDHNDIFWLEVEEVLNFDSSMLDLISKRRDEAQLFRKFNFSTVTSLTDIKNIISGPATHSANDYIGEGLSTGIVQGKVVVINDPTTWKDIEWPANAIVVTQSTDPGWTPIFTKASGIIVERGGVLSHCAIVAREMGIPAVSGISSCHLNFKGGEDVFIDGSSGTVKVIQ